jgi:predicted nucleotide-binding protein
MPDMDAAEVTRYTKKRAHLADLLRRLEEQDRIINAPTPTAIVSLGDLEAIFQNAADALPEKKIHLGEHSHDLLSSIQSLKSKLTDAIDDINSRLATASTPTPMSYYGSSADARHVFVVYGRNSAFRKAMFEFLRAIGLQPMEWGQILRTAQNASPVISEALTQAFAKAKATVVLLSGDDLARLGKSFLKTTDSNDERILTPQARQNVIFEAGMAFGRSPENVIFVSLGYTRPFTDISGIHVAFIDDTVAARQEVAERLEHAGCAVEIKGKNDWHSAGNFTAAVIEPDQISSTTPILEVVRRRVDPQPTASHKPKVYAEIRNNSDHCLEVRILGWKKTATGVKIRYGPNAMQLKIGPTWCPENEGVETLYVGPANRIQAWMEPEADHADANAIADLKRRCQSKGELCQIEFRVNGTSLTLDV